ncbi:MAG: galactokinase family protein [Alkalispirochaeta sp.]
MHVAYESFIAAVPDGAKRLRDLSERFEEHFRRRPTVAASGPGRTELIGNHTDHNNGRVVAAAINADALIVAAPATGSEGSLLSHGWPQAFTANLSADTPDDASYSHDTERLMAGVAAGLRRQDYSAPAYSAVMESRVAPGSGLSSSAALEIALVAIHCGLSREDIDPVTAARVGQYAENRFMNKPSGLMDQMASAVGGTVGIDFADPHQPRYHRLGLNFHSHGQRLVVVNTGGSHADLTDQYAAIPREMKDVASALGVTTLSQTSRKKLLSHLGTVREALGDRALLRAFHFFEEQDRVSAMIDAVDSRMHDHVLQLMQASGISSWTLLQNVAAEGAVREQPIALAVEVTNTYLAARGASGVARVHGGGFAGTMLAVIPEELIDEYHRIMSRAFGDNSVTELTIRQQGMLATTL